MKRKRPSWEPVAGGEHTIEENWLFRLVRERFRSTGTGKEHDYYIIKLADAVNVVALTPARSVVLVRQFRAGSGEDSLETPGGLVGPDEDALSAGVRELAEETGYTGDPPVLLSVCWANPSILSSRIATILVANARVTRATAFDEHEEVRSELVPARLIPQLLHSGAIGHALTIQSLQTWLLHDLAAGGDESTFHSAGSRHGNRSIAGLMGSIAFLAFCFAILRTLGPPMAAVIASTIGLLVARSMLRSFTRPILLREMRYSPAYWALYALVGFGVWIGALTLLLKWINGSW